MQIWLPEVVADLADPADLKDEEVLGRERVVEIVRVDPEQDRGHSNIWISSAVRLGPSIPLRPSMGPAILEMSSKTL